MKKNYFVLYGLVLAFFIFPNQSNACHLASLSIVNGPTNIGGNNYEFTIQICTGTGGTLMGLLCGTGGIGNTQNYTISAAGGSSSGINAAGFTPIITSNFNSIVSTGAVSAGLLTYTASSPIYQIPGTSDTCLRFGSTQQYCWNVTFQTSGLPSTISVSGIEAVDVGQGSTGCTLSVSPVGIHEITSYQNQLNIFPNPSNGIISFSLKQKIFLTSFKIKIFDSFGKFLCKKEIDCNEKNNENKIDLTSLEKGIYFIQTTINDNVIRKKIILE